MIRVLSQTFEILGVKRVLTWPLDWDIDQLSRAILYASITGLIYSLLLFIKVFLAVGITRFARMRTIQIQGEIGIDDHIVDPYSFIIKEDKPLSDAKLDSVSRFQLLRRIY